MLIKLYPNQISDKWDAIGYAIERALPPMIVGDPESMNNILLALLEEKMLCWVYVKDKIEAIITTQVIEDMASKQKNLLLYTAYAINKLESFDWLSGLEALRIYARDKGCKSIIAYTELEYMAKLAKNIGGKAGHMLVSFPV